MFDVQQVGAKDLNDLNVVESIHCTYCDGVHPFLVLGTIRPIKPVGRGAESSLCNIFSPPALCPDTGA